MTSGDEPGTSGKLAWRLGPWGAIALVSIPIVFVNATSQIMDLRSAGLSFELFEPFLWETSSAAILVLLAPLVGLAVRRWPLDGPGVWTSLAVHAGLTLPFAAAHVFALYVVRTGTYLLLDKSYDFFRGGIGLTFIYEWRKDIISYAIFAAVFAAAMWLERRRNNPVSPSGPPDRIEVRDGGKTLFLAPADILYLEAAGNYVEIHTAAAVHLVRGTLAAWDTRLNGLGFARIHRSRLVNRAHIAAMTPTGSGDFEVMLSSGKSLQGSRRFRSSLA